MLRAIIMYLLVVHCETCWAYADVAIAASLVELSLPSQLTIDYKQTFIWRLFG